MTISFIMPAWKALYLEEAISSIIGQTSPDWELVIVDDCSPDNLKSVVARFKDSRITYHRNASNIGGKNLVTQWNYSITYAKGDWIVLAADDDVYAPNFCESVMMLSSLCPDINLIRARVGIIDSKGHQLWEDGKLQNLVSGKQYLEDWMAGKVFTCVGNFAFRRDALVSAGGFKDFPCAFCSDVATPLILSSNGVANTSDIGFFFRQSEINLSGDRTKIREKMEATQLFFEWLRSFAPDFDCKWIHEKCIYDCFNQAVKFASLRELPGFLHRCRVAGFCEKTMMIGRWMKRNIINMCL